MLYWARRSCEMATRGRGSLSAQSYEPALWPTLDAREARARNGALRPSLQFSCKHWRQSNLSSQRQLPRQSGERSQNLKARNGVFLVNSSGNTRLCIVRSSLLSRVPKPNPRCSILNADGCRNRLTTRSFHELSQPPQRLRYDTTRNGTPCKLIKQNMNWHQKL